MISARAGANLFAAGAAAGAAILYRFSPQAYSLYPRCPFFALTHHYCPGCGATRAMAELLHGNFAAALHFNAALTLLLPFVLCYFSKMYWTALRENRIELPSVPDWSWKAAVACVAIFGVTRMFTQGVF
jgi:Protein of unknown function (DUF2752)